MLESSIVHLINTPLPIPPKPKQKKKTKQPPISLLSSNNAYTVKYFLWNEILWQGINVTIK